MTGSTSKGAAGRQGRFRISWLAGAAAVVAVGVGVTGCATTETPQGSSQDATPGATASVTAETFTAQTAAGGQVSVPGSKPSVLFFFSIECGACGPFTKALAEVQRSAPEAANYVAVDVASYETASDVEAFLAQNQASSLAYAIDTNTRLISAYRVNQLSTAVVLDASGTEVFRGVEPSVAQIRDALTKAGAQ